MTQERYATLSKNIFLTLTEEEIKQGWHFCIDWDGMLVGPGMDAQESCLCNEN